MAREAESGVIQSHPRDAWSHWKLEEEEWIHLERSEKCGPIDALTWGLSGTTKGYISLVFKPPHLSEFIIAVREN